MAKKIDITEKLNFEEKPVIVIKGTEIEVNDDAMTMLKIMAKMDDAGNVSPAVLAEMAEMLFTEQGKKNLDSLGLTMRDYSVVIETAMDMITGDGEEGDPPSASMTSMKTGI